MLGCAAIAVRAVAATNQAGSRNRFVENELIYGPKKSRNVNQLLYL